jgi:protoporphyrinogen oxidase
MHLPEKPVILGAGPCGLCVGWNFVNDGIPVTHLEKQGSIGGLSLTFEDEGYFFDLGPHNLHPKYEDVKTFLRNMMGDDMKPYDLSMEIVFRKKRVKYPLKGIHVFRVLPFPVMVHSALNFLFARVMMFLSDPVRDETFEDWITNRFGKTLYNIYFGPYAEKAWKISGSEISGYVAERRVPVLSLTDYIRRALKTDLKHKHSEDGTLDNFYLRKGIGQLSERFGRDILKE